MRVQRLARLARGVTAAGLVAGFAVTAHAQASHAQSSVSGTSGLSAASRRVEHALPELETDRPDITESSSVVGAGLWQLETGTLFQSDHVEPGTLAHDVSLPNALLRVGLNSRMELRLGAEGFLAESLSTPGTGVAAGISDFELGLKYRVLDQQRGGLDLSLIPILSMPVGTAAFSTGGFDPMLKVTLSRDLPAGFGLGSNVIVGSISEDHERFTQTGLSTSLAHDIGAGWGAFWELYGVSAMARGGSAAWLADTGVTRAFGRNLQMDVSVGRGLASDAPDWFIGLGFAIRGHLRR